MLCHIKKGWFSDFYLENLAIQVSYENEKSGGIYRSWN